eukprot:GHVT01098621.1.p1 GENE.GHVT01098621.1~~GHVT01098621.1.p1  ORF type:complete len:375 (+),score=34.63 GHVT01098621.1:401-1525(+)
MALPRTKRFSRKSGKSAPLVSMDSLEGVDATGKGRAKENHLWSLRPLVGYGLAGALGILLTLGVAGVLPDSARPASLTTSGTPRGGGSAERSKPLVEPSSSPSLPSLAYSVSQPKSSAASLPELTPVEMQECLVLVGLGSSPSTSNFRHTLGRRLSLGGAFLSRCVAALKPFYFLTFLGFIALSSSRPLPLSAWPWPNQLDGSYVKSDVPQVFENKQLDSKYSVGDIYGPAAAWGWGKDRYVLAMSKRNLHPVEGVDGTSLRFTGDVFAQDDETYNTRDVASLMLDVGYKCYLIWKNGTHEKFLFFDRERFVEYSNFLPSLSLKQNLDRLLSQTGRYFEPWNIVIDIDNTFVLSVYFIIIFSLLQLLRCLLRKY